VKTNDKNNMVNKPSKNSGNTRRSTSISRQYNFEQTDELLRHVVIPEQIHDAVIVTDLEGKIIKWSSGAQRLLGYKEDEMLGKPMEVMYPDASPEMDQSKIINILKR